MTHDERLHNFLESLKLGPVVLYHGVNNDGHCECGDPRLKIPKFKNGRWGYERHQRAKHPWFTDWPNTATSDPEVVGEWLSLYPYANIAVATGHRCIVLDLDVRDSKNGIVELDALAEAAGERIPSTVTVISGSGAKHLYFAIPPEAERLKKPKGTKGIDLQSIGKAAIAAGSRHINGNYYRFAPGLSPSEIGMAKIPDWLLALMVSSTPTKAPSNSTGRSGSMDEFFEDMILKGPPEGSLPPGRLRPDNIVIFRMKKTPMRKYPDDRSHSDSHWAWTLAHNTCHHWDQFVRIWRHSEIRQLGDTKCGRVGYERSVLNRAFVGQKQQWLARRPKPPLSKSANPRLSKLMEKMRQTTFDTPRSEVTNTVLYVHNKNPDLNDRGVAEAVNREGTLPKPISREHVKRIRYRFQQYW